MNEADYEKLGFHVIKCFPNSFKRVWAQEASEEIPTAADEQAWQGYNVALQLGHPTGFAVLHFPDHATWEAAAGAYFSLTQFTRVSLPDGSIALWFLNQEPGAINSVLPDLGAKLIVTGGWPVPAPPSSIEDSLCEFVHQASPLLLPFWPPITNATPAQVRPFSLQAIPLRGYMAFGPPEQPQLVASGLLDGQSKVILAGVPKIGKSRLALNFAFALATKTDFIGFPVLKAARVLFIQFEVSERRFRMRVNDMARAMKIPPDNSLDFFLITLPRLRMDVREGISEFYRLVRVCKADVVFLDPMVKLHTGNENEQSDMQVLLNTLDDAIEDLGISIVLVHHLSKAGDGESWARIRGSSYIPAWADSMLIMERASQDAPPQVRGILRNGEDFVRAIKFEANHTLQLIGDIRAAMKDAIKDEVFLSVGLNRKQIAAKVAKVFNADIAEVFGVMKVLETEGFALPA